MVNLAHPTLPSADYLALVRTPASTLASLMMRGDTPDPVALVDWEWRGTNMPASSRLLGLRRFIKGFGPGPGDSIVGYNVSVMGADLSSPWLGRRQRDGRREWAGFTAGPVDPTARDNVYLHAMFLDYGAVANPESGVAGMLRDYVVRVAPGSDELLLGRAFIAAGPLRVSVGWFALERLSRVQR
jgi:hypothetical protein